MAAPYPLWCSVFHSKFSLLRNSHMISSKVFQNIYRPSVAKLSQNRRCSINSSDNDDRLSRFEKLLRERRRQANKTVLIHIYSKFVAFNLYNYCQKYGKISKAYHYSLQSDKDFILMEFENESSCNNLLSEVKHFNYQNIIPVESKCLYYQEHHQGKDVLFPTELESDAIASESEINASLHHAKSVSEQMIRLHGHLKLTDMGQQLRFFVCHQLEMAFSGLFSYCTVLPFGSTVNGFGKIDCDLDMVLTLKDESLSEANVSEGPFRLYFHTKRSLSNGKDPCRRHLEALSEIIQIFIPGCSNVQRILQARVPIVKFCHDLVNTECDLSMNNLSGVYMSELLYLYAEFDRRLQPLVFTILKWAKETGLTRDSPGKWITNFSLIAMVIFFLQTRGQQILPSLGTLKQLAGPSDKRVTCGIDCTFLRDIDQFPAMNNNESLEELLFGFFHYYSTFDYKRYGLSLIAGKTVSKPDYSPFYVENPLEVSLNVCKNVSGDEVERIREMMKNALWALEISRENADHPWGLLTLFNVQATPSSSNLHRIKMKDLFDRTGKNNNESYNGRDHANELRAKNTRNAKRLPNDVVAKLELDKMLARKSQNRKNQEQTKSKSRIYNGRTSKDQFSPILPY